MANNSKDIDKILQDIKSRQGAAQPAAAPSTASQSRLQDIIKAETAAKSGAVSAPQSQQSDAKPPVEIKEQKTVSADANRNTAHEIENEFLSKLATALKENPAVSDLVEDEPAPIEDGKPEKPVSVTAASYVDDKFVDFFTQSIAVQRPESTSEIVIKRKKHGFFKKKYITDSLSLSIPQEEIDKRQQKVAKTSTGELARDFIKNAAKSVKPETAETDTNPVLIKPKKGSTIEFDPQPVQTSFAKPPILPKAENFKGVIPADTKAEPTAAPKADAPKTAAADGKTAENIAAAYTKPAEKPKDAESILAALKAKKTATMHTVAVAGEKAETVAEPAKVQADKNTVAAAKAEKPADTATAAVNTETAAAPSETVTDETGYIPHIVSDETGYVAVTAKAEEKPIKVVPKTAAEEKVNRITGDITQMFAHLAAEKKTAQGDTTEVDVADSEDEEVFEPLIAENDFITQQFSDDPKEIYDELRNFKFTLGVRVAISALCAVVLFYLNFAAANGWPLPQAIDPIAQPVLFYLVALVFFAVAVIGFLPTVANGFTGFFKAPTQDSFLVLPAVLSFVQLNVAMLKSSEINPENVTIFAGFTVVAFGFNALGKIISANTILRNLDLAEVPEGINAGYVVKDFDEVKRLARTLEEKNPQILVSRRTGYISNFISGGFSTHRSERHSKLLSFAAVAVAVVCFAITMVVNKSWINAVFAATAASVFTLPLSHSLISSVPGSMMQKALNKVGALVNGWQGIYQLSETTHVSFDAKHLFPKGCVVLHGIKTFEKERLDLAILYAASIAIEKCDNLRSVFMNVIDGKMDMLYPIESCEYKVGQGYVAWIENNRVIMGNRNIMADYNVALPPLSMETNYISEGKKPIYLSVNGKLFGMFVVSYHPDEAVKENLMHLVEQGKNVILQSNDFNIDSQLLEIVYGLPEDTVQVLNKNETTLLLGYTAYSESTDCAMAHLDSLHSLSAGFFGADCAKRAAATCSLVQIASVVIGAVLSVVFTISQTIWEIPLTSVLLLGLGWLGLCMMRALATKYL
ncbi:MAG: hypothetical protein J6K30_09515 [Oscillospiraceae bacterium]|nr:hypothetical protein [Oscillospiraceae bacterium]